MVWVAAVLTLAGAWFPDVRVQLFLYSCALPFWALACWRSYQDWRG